MLIALLVAIVAFTLFLRLTPRQSTDSPWAVSNYLNSHWTFEQGDASALLRQGSSLMAYPALDHAPIAERLHLLTRVFGITEEECAALLFDGARFHLAGGPYSLAEVSGVDQTSSVQC